MKKIIKILGIGAVLLLVLMIVPTTAMGDPNHGGWVHIRKYDGYTVSCVQYGWSEAGWSSATYIWTCHYTPYNATDPYLEVTWGMNPDIP